MLKALLPFTDFVTYGSPEDLFQAIEQLSQKRWMYLKVTPSGLDLWLKHF